jgi:hypothetical protein
MKFQPFLPQEEVNSLFNSKSFKNDYLRFLLERRFLYVNVNESVSMYEVTLAFNNLNVTTPLYNGLIANFFFLRFFTGKTPFFLPMRVISTFKTKVYNFQCKVRLTKGDAFDFLLRTFSFASQNTASNDFGFYSFAVSKNEITFFVKNFPYLRIVETHPIFFK